MASADDVIMRWRLCSMEDVHKEVRDAAEMLGSFESHGLQVSMVKSAALPDLAGGGECRHIRRRANYLVCKGPSGLPLVRQFNYLSMTMVHKQPESATLCRRIVAAKHAAETCAACVRTERTRCSRGLDCTLLVFGPRLPMVSWRLAC